MRRGEGASLGRRAERLVKTAPAIPLQKVSTKDLLIDSGELLFGMYGLEGISLREIADAAGQSNSNVVQYHFKNKSGLVHAILLDRLTKIESVRQKFFADLEPAQEKDPRVIYSIFWKSIVEQQDAHGNHPFCRFYFQYGLQFHVAPHPIFELVSVRHEPLKAQPGVESIFPTSLRIERLLWDCYPKMPYPVFQKRISLMSMMFFSAVISHDYVQSLNKRKKKIPFDLEPVLDVAIGAMSAPF